MALSYVPEQQETEETTRIAAQWKQTIRVQGRSTMAEATRGTQTHRVRSL